MCLIVLKAYLLCASTRKNILFEKRTWR